MKITLEWTDDGIDHIRRHNIEPGEIEELLSSKLYRKKRGAYLELLGKTLDGRILFVVIERLEAYRYRVVIARDATFTEKGYTLSVGSNHDEKGQGKGFRGTLQVARFR